MRNAKRSALGAFLACAGTFGAPVAAEVAREHYQVTFEEFGTDRSHEANVTANQYTTGAISLGALAMAGGALYLHAAGDQIGAGFRQLRRDRALDDVLAEFDEQLGGQGATPDVMPLPDALAIVLLAAGL